MSYRVVTYSPIVSNLKSITAAYIAIEISVNKTLVVIKISLKTALNICCMLSFVCLLLYFTDSNFEVHEINKEENILYQKSFHS